MTTYIYLLKATDRMAESAAGTFVNMGQLTAKDIVEAVREGPVFGAETFDPRGNMVSLEAFRRAYPSGDDLWLENYLGTPFALVIFGAQSDTSSKVHKDLQSESEWNSIEYIRGRGDLKAMCAYGKFGTYHHKLLFMLGSQNYAGFPADATPVDPYWMGQIGGSTSVARRAAIDEFLRH